MILKGSVPSDVLEMETGITIITPVTHASGTPCKVVYLLHGLYGSNGNWADFTMLPYFARDYDAVFVMPEVARSFYTDMAHGQKFFTYVSEELPMICKETFNISSNREDTAVIGASMGGYGALKTALSKPEHFGHCCGIASAWLFLKEILEDIQTEQGRKKSLAHYGEQQVSDMYSIFGDDLRWKPECDILELAKNMVGTAESPRIYCTCGTEDFLHTENLRFAQEMKKLPVDFTYEEWNGRHDWFFFNDALKKSLEFCFAK